MYTKVESKFWQDEKIRNISEDARYLMLYLLTSPHRNILGLYFLPLPYACFDLGWDEKRFRKGLGELLDKGLVKYDFETNVIFICNYLKHNPLENSNQVKSAIGKLSETPTTSLFQDLLAILKQLDKPFMKPLQERLRERFAKPSLNSSETVMATVWQTSNSISNSISKEKKEINKERKEIAPDGAVGSSEPTSQSIKEVFDYYNEVFKDCRSKPLLLTPQRKKKISARLKNFTPEELKTVIRNIRASPFHCGENDKGRIYATPEFIFRNDEIVDKWLKEEPKYGGIGGYNPPQVVEV